MPAIGNDYASQQEAYCTNKKQLYYFTDKIYKLTDAIVKQQADINSYPGYIRYHQMSKHTRRNQTDP